MLAVRFDLFSSGKLYRALRDAGYPDLPSPRTVRRWTEGQQPPASAVAMVRDLLDTTKEAPAPEWARAVAAEAADEVIGRLVPPHLLDAAHRLLEQLAAIPPQDDEAQRAGHVRRDLGE